MEMVCSCGSMKFHRVGSLRVSEYGDFGKEGKWEAELTELLYEHYQFLYYICAKCGKFLDEVGNDKAEDGKPLFWHPV